MINLTAKETANGRNMSVALEGNILKEKMLRSAEKCGNSLIQYYIVADNPGREKKMKWMMKDLLYLKIEEPEYICEQVYEEANTHIASAMKYGYEPIDLADLRKCLDEFRGIKKIQRQMMDGKREMTNILQERKIWERSETGRRRKNCLSKPFLQPAISKLHTGVQPQRI